MWLTNGKESIELFNEIQIEAFKNSGYEEFSLTQIPDEKLAEIEAREQAEEKETEAEKAPVKRRAKKNENDQPAN